MFSMWLRRRLGWRGTAWLTASACVIGLTLANLLVPVDLTAAFAVVPLVGLFYRHWPLSVYGTLLSLIAIWGVLRPPVAAAVGPTAALLAGSAMCRYLVVRTVRREKELADLAVRDPLTGVYNRREFFQRLHEEVERARRYNRPCSLLLLDVDHFKRINDVYGHLVGDEALRSVAALIRGEIRAGDLVARYGGEEFAIIVPETESFGALCLAERIRNAVVAQPLRVTPNELTRITVSIGVATMPDDATTVEELFKAADRALYAAKGQGRNRVHGCDTCVQHYCLGGN